MVEEDEEVVFEGSPLDQYLKDVARDKYLVDVHVTGESKNEHSADASLKTSDDHVTCSWRSWLANYCSVYKVEVDITVLVWDVTHSIWTSGLLDADDMHFLEAVDPQCFENPPQSKAAEPLYGVIINVLAVFGLIFALLSQFFLASPNVSATVLVAVFVVLLFSGLSMIGLLLFKYHSLVVCWQWQQFVGDVRNLMVNVRNCYEVYLKCVRLIEEQELITNGYSRRSDQSEICINDLHGCLALRVTMEKTGMPLFLGLREATCQLVQRVPVSCFVDDSSHYIAFVRLESLPVGELSTAPKSLSQLKCLLRLVRSQTSEYFRRLILCFTKHNLHSLWELNRTTKLLKPALTNLLLLSKQWNYSLSKALELQKRLLTENNHISVITKIQQAHKNSDSGVTSLLHAASKTEVSLQAALLRVRELAQHVDTIGHTNQLSAVGAIGEWLELDVSSCVSSCRYLLSNLQSLLHPEPEVADASRIMDSSAFDCQEDGQVCSAVSVSKKVMEDGEQTDDDDDEKVYEAYVPPDENTQEDGFRSPLQCQQFTEAHHDIEDPVKMITELKTVLAAKASAKVKSELGTQQAMRSQGSHVTVHTSCNTVSNSDAHNRPSNGSWEFLGDHTPSPIDMSSLHAAIVKARPRETAATDELEASGEADSDND